jgi:hypothetical protein
MTKQLAPTARDINALHHKARQCAETAVGFAIECGQMLLKRQDLTPSGQFKAWIEGHCDFAYSTALRYLKAAKADSTGVEFSTLSQLYGSKTSEKSEEQKKLSAPNTSARSVKGAVMNPPESAAQGSEAGNRNKPVGVETGQVRPPAPNPEPDPDEPERPDDVDEDAALAAAEADYTRRIDAVMGSDDKLAAASAQLKQQAALIGTLETTRDGYMRGKEAVTKMLQAEQRKTAKLEKELTKLREENETLRERVAIMEHAA